MVKRKASSFHFAKGRRHTQLLRVPSAHDLHRSTSGSAVSSFSVTRSATEAPVSEHSRVSSISDALIAQGVTAASPVVSQEDIKRASCHANATDLAPVDRYAHAFRLRRVGECRHMEYVARNRERAAGATHEPVLCALAAESGFASLSPADLTFSALPNAHWRCTRVLVVKRTAQRTMRLYLFELDYSTNVTAAHFTQELRRASLVANGVPPDQVSAAAVGFVLWRRRLAGQRVLIVCDTVRWGGEGAAAAVDALALMADKWRTHFHIVVRRRPKPTAPAAYCAACPACSPLLMRLVACETQPALSIVTHEHLMHLRYILQSGIVAAMCQCIIFIVCRGSE